MQLCSQTGEDINRVPAEIVKLTSVSEINKAFFSWREEQAKKALEIPAEFNRHLETMLNPKSLPRYKELATKVTQSWQRMEESLRQAEREAARATEAQRELEAYDRMDTPQLADNVRRALGWWRLAHVDNVQIVFLTPGNVVCSWINKEAGIDLRVDMGQMSVIYVPSQQTVRVERYKGCLDLDGFMHPHISPQGTPCWGNTRATVIQAFKEYDVAKILECLRGVLLSYNPDSPYMELPLFAKERNPDVFKNTPQNYVRDQAGWVDLDELEQAAGVETLDNRESDEGTEQALIRIYRLVYAGFGVPVTDAYYYKSGDRYYEIGQDEFEEE